MSRLFIYTSCVFLVVGHVGVLRDLLVCPAVLKQLTPAVYEFVTTVQQQPLENGADGSTEAAGSLKNEERIIPDIIFNLEDFEKHLIQISCYGKFPSHQPHTLDGLLQFEISKVHESLLLRGS